MAFLPLTYNTRSLLVRRGATLLTVVSIAATVVVVAGVLALEQGFSTLFEETGREDLAVFFRPGSTSESESYIPLVQSREITKELSVIAEENGRKLASAECYLAVRRKKRDGGETNVPIRGVEPMTFAIHGDQLRVIRGERFRPASNELIVGKSLVDRIEGCDVGETILLNNTPFRVTGVFDHPGPYASEIWGDLDAIAQALGLRDIRGEVTANRILAKLKPGTDVDALAKALEKDQELPVKTMTERAYLASQTTAISTVLAGLGFFLAIIMGVAAIFTGTNTMLAALAARTHEIGVLLSIGFRPLAIFVSFLFEALVLGFLGGLLGAALTLPLNGIQTGTTNWQTFTEIAFAFRVTPYVLGTAVTFAIGLGLIGGLWPAWRAAHLEPTEALRGR